MKRKIPKLIAHDHALLDLIFKITDQKLTHFDIPKGGHRLIGDSDLKTVLEELKESTPHAQPGGSAANTCRNYVSLGGTASFISRIGRDSYGKKLKEALETAGVDTALKSSEDGHTGLCITLLTPDGDRSFLTYRGQADELSAEDIGSPPSPPCLYLIAGYLLCGNDKNGALADKILDKSVEEGTQIALSLGASHLCSAHRERFMEALPKVSYLFGNEEEATTLTQTKSPEEALEALTSKERSIIITCGERGALLAYGQELFTEPGIPITPKNTNGAGDLFAAAFLYQIAKDEDPQNALHISNRLAAKQIASG